MLNRVGTQMATLACHRGQGGTRDRWERGGAGFTSCCTQMSREAAHSCSGSKFSWVCQGTWAAWRIQEETPMQGISHWTTIPGSYKQYMWGRTVPPCHPMLILWQVRQWTSTLRTWGALRGGHDPGCSNRCVLCTWNAALLTCSAEGFVV